VTDCRTCGGYGNRHDPIAHGWVTEWITCPGCDGDGCVRWSEYLDITCPVCDGDGGREP
jgi:DnaJ-class molecular chaperone